MGGGFTDEVKQELAGLPTGPERLDRAELAALLRFGGALVVVGGDVRRIALDLETASGATARRTFGLLHRLYDLRAELRVRSPGGVRTRLAYGLRLDDGAAEIAADLALVTHGLPSEPRAATDAASAAATLRGAFLAAGSISSPDRAPHLEVAAHHEAAAVALAATARLVTAGTVSVSTGTGDRPRVVVKSGAAIGELLAGVGASHAFLRWDERRLRRQLRGEATRLTNADAANLRRSIEAASSQVRAVERVVAAVGWDDLDEELRQVALARLTSPEASLADLGELTDPRLSRSTLHRRLKRLERMAEELDGSPTDGPPTGAA